MHFKQSQPCKMWSVFDFEVKLSAEFSCKSARLSALLSTYFEATWCVSAASRSSTLFMLLLPREGEGFNEAPPSAPVMPCTTSLERRLHR